MKLYAIAGRKPLRQITGYQKSKSCKKRINNFGNYLISFPNILIGQHIGKPNEFLDYENIPLTVKILRR